MTEQRLSLSQYRQQRRETLVLPSGLPVTVKRISLEEFMLSGEIPLGGLGAIIATGPATEGALETIGRPYLTMLNEMVAAALIDPAVTGVATDTTLESVEELDFADRMTIYEWLTGVPSLDRFPDGPELQNTGAMAGPDGAAVRHATGDAAPD